MGRPASDSGFSDRPRGCRTSLSVARRCAGWQREEGEAGGRLGSASVSVVETTNSGLGHDPPLARWLNLAWPGSVAVEGLVGPRVVVQAHDETPMVPKLSFRTGGTPGREEEPGSCVRRRSDLGLFSM